MSPDSDMGVMDPTPGQTLTDFYHGMLVFDFLFGMDADGAPQPQMVGDWSISSDGLIWDFTFRDGLMWHDGRAVTANQVTCSFNNRFFKANNVGKIVAKDMESFVPTSDDSFRLTMKVPTSLVLVAFAENIRNAPLIYDEQGCQTDISEAADVTVGQGPMKFVEWNPGADALYVRNEEYVPRSEPVSDYAGGKIINIDELRYQIIPDPNTRAIALETGLVDMIDTPLNDDFERLDNNSDLVVRFDKLEGFDLINFNQIAHPFDNVNARRAIIVGMAQRDLLAAAYPPGFWTECGALFGCGQRWESSVGPINDAIQGDPDKARELWAQSDYDGRPIVIRTWSDNPNMFNFGLVLQEFLQDELDVEVEFLSGDIPSTFGRLYDVQHTEEGGWHLSMIWATAGGQDPIANVCLRSPWNGHREVPRILDLQAQFGRELTEADQRATVDDIQRIFYEEAVCFNAGQHKTYRAWSTEVKDVISGFTRTYPIIWGLWLDR